jgi:hypothetical protein
MARGGWFRMYEEALDDPKVQRLSGDDFKAWINLLCLASRNGGRLPPSADVAFALRMDAHGAATLLSRLADGGLLDTRQGGAHGSHHAPHGWEERQYKSDTSTDRVKRFRQRSKTVTETAPDTDSETEVPEAKASGEIQAFDAETVMFRHGRLYLTANGVKPDKAGSLLGKWKRDHGAEAVIVALGKAQREGAIDPVSYIEACLRQRSRDDDERYEMPC